MRENMENTAITGKVAPADAEKIVAFLMEDAPDVPAPTRQDVERAVASPDLVVRAATLKALLHSQSPMDYRGEALYRVSEPLLGSLAAALGEDRDALADRILERCRPSDFTQSAAAIAGVPAEHRDAFHAILKNGWRFLGAAAMTSSGTIRNATGPVSSTPAPALRLVSGTWYLFGRPTYFDDSAFTELRAAHESALQTLSENAVERPVLALKMPAEAIEFTATDVTGRGLVATGDFTRPPSPATAGDRRGFRFEKLDGEAPPEALFGATRRRWFGSPSLDWVRIRTGW